MASYSATRRRRLPFLVYITAKPTYNTYYTQAKTNKDLSMWSDLLQLIPQNLKQKALDTLVDVVSEQAKKYAGEGLSAKVKKLRSDTAFRDAFEEGLSQAMQRFIEEYQNEDEDLVIAISKEQEFFLNKEVQTALIAVLKQPGAYLDEERKEVLQTFVTILPERINRERVDRAVSYLLKCLAQELWHLPELMPIYSLQFQRITAESSREQVSLQRAQLQALTNLNTGVREALLQLTDVIVEQKLLSAGAASDFSSSPKVLHNLPQPDFDKFIGREAEQIQIHNLLRPYPHSRHFLIVIDGIGGIGKSALALEIAHHYLRNYAALLPQERFDAIIWTSAKSNILTAEGIAPRRQIMRTLDDIYTAIAVALQREDITRAQPEEQDEIVRRALTQQRTLLIVDNLETVDDENVLAFLRELPDPTKAIVTTRHRIDVAYSIRLVGMEWDDANAFIIQESNLRGLNLSSDEAHHLYARTGGVPLALVWSIAQMNYGYSVETILTRLSQPKNDIIKFCFDTSLTYIKDKAPYQLLMALSLFVPDGSRDALGFVANLADLDRDDGVVVLEKLSLVNKETNRFSLLPITRTFATAELIKDSTVAKSFNRRLVDYLLNKYSRMENEPDSEYRLRYSNPLLYQDGISVLEALEWAYEHGTTNDVFDLSLVAIDYLDVVGRWNTLSQICGQALDLARTVNNAPAVGRLANSKGWLLEQRGEYAEAKAHFEEGLENYRKAGNKEGESILLQRLSGIYRKTGKFSRAKELLDEARKIAGSLNLGDVIALIDTQQGKLARDMQNYEESWQYFMKVNAWFEHRVEESPRDEQLAAGVWGQLAIVAYYLNRPEEAKSLCLRSLEFFEDHGTKGYMATLKYRLALAEEKLGEFDSARSHLKEALLWFDRLSMKPDYEAAKIKLEQLK